MEKSKIKVLQVNKLYYPVTGGIEQVVQQIAEGLNDKTDMKVLVCREKGKTIIETVNNVKVFRAGSIGKFLSMPVSFSFFKMFKQLSSDSDVVHLHMPFPLGDIACLLSGFKGKIVVWWHSDIVRQKKVMLFYRPIMEKLLKRADVIIVATQGHIDGSDYLPKYSSKCVIIPYGVDRKIAKRADEYVGKARITNKKTANMLFVGRLVYYKGCDILLDAFKQTEGAELTIIGEGKLKEELIRKSELMGLSKKVHFLGKVDNERLIKAYEECDILILPSVAKSEAFGLVQIEAMSFGKPVINTNLASGVPHVSLDSITGLTVPPNDVQALAHAMKWMIEHEDERVEMGRKARTRVKDFFQIDMMLNEIYEIYKKTDDYPN